MSIGTTALFWDFPLCSWGKRPLGTIIFSFSLKIAGFSRRSVKERDIYPYIRISTVQCAKISVAGRVLLAARRFAETICNYLEFRQISARKDHRRRSLA